MKKKGKEEKSRRRIYREVIKKRDREEEKR